MNFNYPKPVCLEQQSLNPAGRSSAFYYHPSSRPVEMPTQT